MLTRKSYFSLVLVLMLLLTGVSSLSCSCSPAAGQSTQKAGSLSPTANQKGDPDWWKKQPDLKKEETAINETKTNILSAFNAKDTDKALTYFAPDDREKFKTLFSKYPDFMPQFAKDMENATLSFMSLDTEDTLYRIAEYTMKVDGNTFYIEFIKIDDKWFIKNF